MFRKKSAKLNPAVVVGGVKKRPEPSKQKKKPYKKIAVILVIFVGLLIGSWSIFHKNHLVTIQNSGYKGLGGVSSKVPGHPSAPIIYEYYPPKGSK